MLNSVRNGGCGKRHARGRVSEAYISMRDLLVSDIVQGCSTVHDIKMHSCRSALEIRTERLTAMVATNSEKLGATLKSYSTVQ